MLELYVEFANAIAASSADLYGNDGAGAGLDSLEQPESVVAQTTTAETINAAIQNSPLGSFRLTGLLQQ